MTSNENPQVVEPATNSVLVPVEQEEDPAQPERATSPWQTYAIRQLERRLADLVPGSKHVYFYLLQAVWCTYVEFFLLRRPVENREEEEAKDQKKAVPQPLPADARPRRGRKRKLGNHSLPSQSADALLLDFHSRVYRPEVLKQQSSSPPPADTAHPNVFNLFVSMVFFFANPRDMMWWEPDFRPKSEQQSLALSSNLTKNLLVCFRQQPPVSCRGFVARFFRAFSANFRPTLIGELFLEDGLLQESSVISRRVVGPHEAVGGTREKKTSSIDGSFPGRSDQFLARDWGDEWNVGTSSQDEREDDIPAPNNTIRDDEENKARSRIIGTETWGKAGPGELAKRNDDDSGGEGRRTDLATDTAAGEEQQQKKPKRKRGRPRIKAEQKDGHGAVSSGGTRRHVHEQQREEPVQVSVEEQAPEIEEDKKLAEEEQVETTEVAKEEEEEEEEEEGDLELVAVDPLLHFVPVDDVSGSGCHELLDPFTGRKFPLLELDCGITTTDGDFRAGRNCRFLQPDKLEIIYGQEKFEYRIKFRAKEGFLDLFYKEAGGKEVQHFPLSAFGHSTIQLKEMKKSFVFPLEYVLPQGEAAAASEE